MGGHSAAVYHKEGRIQHCHVLGIPVVHQVTSSPFRLSYRQRIAEVVPEQFDCFVPMKPEPVYKFANDTAGEFSRE